MTTIDPVKYLEIAELAFWKAVHIDSTGELKAQGDAEFWMMTANTAIRFCDLVCQERIANPIATIPTPNIYLPPELTDAFMKIWQALENIEVHLRNK